MLANTDVNRGCVVIENYLGAKGGSGVYQTIINLIPPHDTYIELFLGTGQVMRRKCAATRNIGIDLNKRCIDEFESPYENVELLNMDAFEFLKNFDFSKSGRTVVYADPPYPHETRTSSSKYDYELTDKDHKNLLNLLSGIDAQVLISSYPNDIYNSLDWWKVSFQAMTRGGVRTENVWCNFEPKDMHYHTFAGKDFTDRQRIKRKAERWAKKYGTLSPGERSAILSALLQMESEL